MTQQQPTNESETMTVTNETLNQVASLLNTTDKAAVLLASVKVLVDNGADVHAAFDFVIGEGSYNKLKSELHARLTA